MRRSRRIPLDPSAWWPLAGSAVLLVLALFGPWPRLAAIPGALFFTIGFFFRDPERTPPANPLAFVSPADGAVTGVSLTDPAEAGPVGGPHISIFLAVWNVHVNRAPQDGVVEKVDYAPGGHSVAWAESAGANESNWICFRNGAYRFVVRQVAGKVARRVVCRLRVGDAARRGERLGIIKFGSRTDLHLPAGCRVLVRDGDRVHGGRSVVALLPERGNGALA
jgi:phosphatidylserine decarboxylase